jgi:hypothetical protein
MNLGMTYIPSHLPKHIETDMQALNRIGCDEVLFALSENNLFVLEGAWKFGAKIARENGLRPLAVVWGYANTFGGGRISQIMLNDPEMWVRDRKGAPVPLACFNNPKIIARFLEIVDRLVAASFEAIFVDEPTPQDCWCDHCREKFWQAYGEDMEKCAGSLDDEDFRRRDTTDYVRAICSGVKQAHPELATMACLMPQDRACWEEIAALEHLDDFGTDPYWLFEPMHLTLSEGVDLSQACRALAVRHRKRSHVWLNAWKIPAGREPEIYTGGLALAGTGHDSLFTWSYLGGLGTNEESDNPAEVWKYVTRLYEELSKAG